MLASKPPRDNLVGLTEPIIETRGESPLDLPLSDGRPTMPKKTQLSVY